VRRQTYGYLPSHGASPPFDRHQIILLDEQKMLPGSPSAGSRTSDLAITSPICYRHTTKPYI